MKKIGLSALLGLALLASCGDGGEKEAQIRLRKAEAALQQENFSEAKLQIDSIKVLYPKAFEARKQGIKLMQQVDLKEQGKTLVYLDSMMQVKQSQLDSIKGNFVLEKDTAYQDIGNWFYPTQVVEKSLGRTYLRGQVQGVLVPLAHSSDLVGNHSYVLGTRSRIWEKELVLLLVGLSCPKPLECRVYGHHH